MHWPWFGGEINYNSSGSVDMTNPFGTSISSSLPSNVEEKEEMKIEKPEEIDEGENIQNEESGEGM